MARTMLSGNDWSWVDRCRKMVPSGLVIYNPLLVVPMKYRSFIVVKTEYYKPEYFGKFLVTHHPEVIAGPSAERAFADRVDRIIEECNAVYNGFVGSFVMLPGIPVECKPPGIVGYLEYTVGCDG